MANSSAEEGEQSLVEVYSLGGKLLAKLPRPAESSLTSLEEALNLQAEDDDDLGLVWRLAHSGPLGAEPLFATREPLLQVKVRELCDEVYALPSMYIQVRKMLQFKNVHGSAVKEDGKQYPSRILFRRTEASDLQMAERLYNEFMFLLIWRNENFVVVQDLFVAPAASGGCWYCIFDYMETSMAAVLRSPMHLHLTTNHVDYFAYNILRGLRFLHSLGYAHGNVCPSNVWLNANDDIQLSDLCFMHPADAPIADEASAEVREFYQGIVADLEWQHHRPLEVLESRSLGGAPGDMWAMGCFLVELLFRRRLLPGSDLEDQRRRIAQLDQELETLSPKVAGVDIDFQELEIRVETARGCLALPATSRLTAEAMIQASWLAELHAVEDCPTISTKFSWRTFASFAELRVALMSLRRAAEAH